MLEKKVYDAFSKIVGERNISQDPAVMDSYAFQWCNEIESAQRGEEPQRFGVRPLAVVLPESLEQVQDIVNEKIAAALPISFEIMTVDEAKKQGAIGLFEERYGDKVKVYSVGDYSKEICGGPHLESTKEMGHFKITKEESSSAGIRRIKAVLE